MRCVDDGAPDDRATISSHHQVIGRRRRPATTVPNMCKWWLSCAVESFYGHGHFDVTLAALFTGYSVEMTGSSAACVDLFSLISSSGKSVNCLQNGVIKTSARILHTMAFTIPLNSTAVWCYSKGFMLVFLELYHTVLQCAAIRRISSFFLRILPHL